MAEKMEIFHSRMVERIDPSNTAKELVEGIVRSALEVEYGSGFALSSGFGKMVSKIADVVVSNPELRRQALSVAGSYIDKKMEETKLRKTSSPEKTSGIDIRVPLPISRQELDKAARRPSTGGATIK
jgi:hypothetical protein